jgi:dGTPase
MERCACDKEYAAGIMPSTLEGAVVRISDIIAYLGKDRQDAVIARAVAENAFSGAEIGSINAEIVAKLVGNLIENSKGKPYIKLDEEHFEMLKKAKKENYEKIYNQAESYTGIGKVIEPMMEEIYSQLLDDLKADNRYSPIFNHHIRQVKDGRGAGFAYEKTEPNQLVVDYIASMTDDYFIELHGYLFKGSPYQVKYRGYFDEE